MARERMVTRTINERQYECVVLNLKDYSTTFEHFSLTGDIIADDEKALKTLDKTYSTPTAKIVSIKGYQDIETIYGMLEVDFIKIAHKLTADRKIAEIE